MANGRMRIVVAGSALLLAAGVGLADRSAVEVRVSGRPMVVSGQREIARGLMGVHSYGLNEENVERYGISAIRQIHFNPSSHVSAIDREGQVRPLYRRLAMAIDCPGDRYCPPTILSNPNYAEFFERIGREYAQRCKDADWPGWVEFWNEPYLNWASRSHGSNRNVYSPHWYETEGRQDGGRVTIKGWDEPLEHLRWRRHWARGQDGRIYYGVAIPEGLQPGDTFRGASPAGWYFTNRDEQTFTVVEEWGIHDPTQVSFWSGLQNLDFYLRMFLPFARAVKETNPDVTVIGGWDFGLHHGDWQVWRELTIPIIDAAHPWLDGIAEHHYGLNTRWVPMWYDVATSYAYTRYGRWIKGYNTETGGRLDPAVHGQARNISGTTEGTYALRDIMELLYHCPANSGSRTAHHPDQGVLNTLAFLKDLRGQLVAADSPEPDVWPVASIDGRRMVMVAFNNASEVRRLDLTLDAPTGTTFTGGSWNLDLADATTFEAGGRQARLTVEVPSFRAVKVVMELSDEPAIEPVITRGQFFALPGPLTEVPAGEQVELSVEVPAAMHAGARRVWLKLSMEKVEGDDLRVSLNGQDVPFPSRNFTTLVEVDVSRIGPRNTLSFHGGEKGYRVCVASLVIDTE